MPPRIFENGREVFPEDREGERAATRRALAIRAQAGSALERWEPPRRGYPTLTESSVAVPWNTTSYGGPDGAILPALAPFRDRARSLEGSNPYMDRWLSELFSNVVGEAGVRLQMRVLTPRGKVDKKANVTVEDAWARWNEQGQCDVTGELSGLDIDRLVLCSTARDGDSMVRTVPGFPGNRFGFAVQLIEGDALDHRLNVAAPGGNYITMGVEKDKFRRPVKYHLLTNSPADAYPGSPYVYGLGNPSSHEPVDAKNIIHVLFRNRIGQTRGITWTAAVQDAMRMLRGYEEAELIAARAEACKGGFLYSDLNPEGGSIGEAPDPTTGNVDLPMTPGEMRGLPWGVKFQAHNPTHPNGNYGEYRKGVLRAIASGLGMSYNILANDLVGVSYSSLRGGLLDERDLYKIKQRWFINCYKTRLFRVWLEFALLSGQLKGYGIADYDYLNRPAFRPRRWDWVDPMKDISAAILAVNFGLSSRQREILNRGHQIEDIFREISEDEELADSYELEFTSPQAANPAANDADSEGPEDVDTQEAPPAAATPDDGATPPAAGDEDDGTVSP